MSRIFLVLAFVLAGHSSTAWGATKQEERLTRAAEVIQEIMRSPDQGIPEDLLQRAACVAVVPSVKKFALGFGGRHGAGYVLCRQNKGTGSWGPPSGFSISGGSFGLQLGFSATDYVLLFMNAEGIEKLIQDKFTLGADAAVAGGPVGRNATAATDAQLKAKILGYSRSKGLFAGLALEGAVLKPSSDDNEELYGRKLSAKELLLDSAVPPPASSAPLLQALATASNPSAKASTPNPTSNPTNAPETGTGTILGTVRDPSGAVLPDARITVKNVATGAGRTLSVDPTGQYRAAGLPVGTYEVAAEVAGFPNRSFRQASLTAGNEVVVDLILDFGR